jgi:quinol-cytochrome oxidoreductase complex cytochrome b subunit
VVVPGALVTALGLLPYLDRQPKGVGRWFARERVVANTLFTICLAIAVVFTVIGTSFRGPNWAWTAPWKPAPAITEGH